MRIAVSACLLGINCKYNGGNNRNEKVLKFVEGHEVVTVCPEVLGGLNIPRNPGEIVDGKVLCKDGKSVDYEYHIGAQKALDIVMQNNCELAILQSRSPSCGVNEIYDGTFSGRKIKGKGIFAGLLVENGIWVLDAENID